MHELKARRLRAYRDLRAVVGLAAAAPLLSCGAAPAKRASMPHTKPAPATAADAKSSGPTAEWNELVERRQVWAEPELKNYCPGESLPRFLPEATSGDYPDIAAARESGCSVLGTSREGTTVCCPASLPVATNPNTGGGKGCDEALLDYSPTEQEEEAKSPSAGKYGAVLNRGSYFAHCHAPDSTRLSICAAIRNGKAVGVTVKTQPYQPELAECVAKSVRGLRFPSRSRMDVTKTTF